jgi:hypothetical protein
VTTVYAHLQPQLDGRALQSHAQHTPPDTRTHTWGGGGGGGSLPMAPPSVPSPLTKGRPPQGGWERGIQRFAMCGEVGLPRLACPYSSSSSSTHHSPPSIILFPGPLLVLA